MSERGVTSAIPPTAGFDTLEDAITEPTDARRGPQRRAHLHTTENWRGRTAVVSVSGEMDMMTASLLEAAINAAVESEPTAVIVDLHEVDFMASAGTDVLLVAHRTVTQAARFGVVADGRNTRRPIELVGCITSCRFTTRSTTRCATLRGHEAQPAGKDDV